MAVTIEDLGGLQRRVMLTISDDIIAQETQQRLQKLAGQVKIDGFRRGKIPAKVLKERYGSAVYVEALNELINKEYISALKAANIIPVGAPQVVPVQEEATQYQPIMFYANFEVFPKIDLTDLSTLNITRPVATLQESDFDVVIERIRQQYAITAENGDKQLPELTPEFIASLGVQGGVDAFKQEIKKNLERELKYLLKSKVKAQVIEKLLIAHDFEIPQALIEQEAERIHEESTLYFKKMNMKIKPPEIPLNSFKEKAHKNVKIGLLFAEIFDQKQITATPEKIEEYVRDMATMYDDTERAVQWIQNDKTQMKNIRAQVQEDLLIEKVLELATVTDSVLSYPELLQSGVEQ